MRLFNHPLSRKKGFLGNQRGIAPIVWPLITTGAGLIGSLFKKKKSKDITVTQEPLITPDQQKARDLLNAYALTGKLGDFQAGEEYGGPLGDYNLSDLELTGKTAISDLMKAGTPEMLDLAKTQVKSILSGGQYDPYSPTGEYAPFKASALREAKTASDTLARGASVRGKLSSAAATREQGLLSENLGTNLQSKLAELNDRYIQRKLSAIPMAANLASGERGMELQNISAAYNYGAIERLMKDKAAQDAYTAWLNTRGEQSTRLNALSTMATSSIPWGAKSVTLPGTEQPSPWSNLLNTGIGMFGDYLGNKMR